MYGLYKALEIVVSAGVPVMRRLIVWSLFALVSMSSANATQEFLSASENRLARMTNLCEAKLGLSSQECGCIFSKSFETNLSNVDLSFYYANARHKLSSTKLTTLDRLRKACVGNVATPAPKPQGSTPYSSLVDLCVSQDNMDAARCNCLFKRGNKKGYQTRDMEWFLKGRASKVSEFNIYTEITIDLLKCEKQVSR